MPKPHPHHATLTFRASVLPSLAHHGLTRPCVEMGLLKACSSVAQALEHEGNGCATGT